MRKAGRGDVRFWLMAAVGGVLFRTPALVPTVSLHSLNAAVQGPSPDGHYRLGLAAGLKVNPSGLSYRPLFVGGGS